MTVLTIVTVLVVGVVVWDLVGSLARHRTQHWALARNLRLRHFAIVTVVVPVTAAAAAVLSSLPVLSWGWWQAIGGEGSVVFARNRSLGPVSVLISLAVMVLLVAALPALVREEELLFRVGSEHRSRARQVALAVVFGSVHALVGIPLGTAVALTVPGLVFTREYLRGYRETEAALAESDAQSEPEPEDVGTSEPLDATDVSDSADAADASDAELGSVARRAAVDASATLHLAWNIVIIAVVFTATVAVALGRG